MPLELSLLATQRRPPHPLHGQLMSPRPKVTQGPALPQFAPLLGLVLQPRAISSSEPIRRALPWYPRTILQGAGQGLGGRLGGGLSREGPYWRTLIRSPELPHPTPLAPHNPLGTLGIKLGVHRNPLSYMSNQGAA